MPTHKLLLLPGDSIGPEVMAEAKNLIAWMNKRGLGPFEIEEGLVGGAAYDAHKVAVTDATMALAQAADAVIFGAVGGPMPVAPSSTGVAMARPPSIVVVWNHWLSGLLLHGPAGGTTSVK